MFSMSDRWMSVCCFTVSAKLALNASAITLAINTDPVAVIAAAPRVVSGATTAPIIIFHASTSPTAIGIYIRLLALNLFGEGALVSDLDNPN